MAFNLLKTPTKRTPASPSSPNSPAATEIFTSPIQAQMLPMWRASARPPSAAIGTPPGTPPCTPPRGITARGTDTAPLSPVSLFDCCDHYCRVMRICTRCVSPGQISRPLKRGHPNSAKGTCHTCRRVVIQATHVCEGKPPVVGAKRTHCHI